MKKSLLFTTAACALAIPTLAVAAPLSPGKYAALDFNGSRSIYSTAQSDFVEGAGVSTQWSFDPGANFEFDGSTATLSAIASNVGVDALKIAIDMTFNVTPTQTPYCQQGGPKDCSGQSFDTSEWTYFTVASSTWTGLGDMAGIIIDITSDAGHNPQAGIGANALDGDLGFSMWFDWTASGTATSANASNYTFNTSGGTSATDINIDLAPVPLPAAGWLLVAGLAGLGALRRRS
ncbi:MAG: VPLPA-CTERM sorting domain-containing protein [Pseudomonadota bacterium]